MTQSESELRVDSSLQLDPASPLEDPRELNLAVEQYLALVEIGKRPHREEFLARHPDIEGVLGQCIDSIEFIESAAGRLNLPSSSSIEAGPIPPSGVLGDYRIIREIGRGGMGVVYEAEQISLKRPVAVKILPFAAVMDKRQLQRFKNEAQAAATLRHPNIVGVHAVGCERGVHYYAMEYIEGLSLAQLIDQSRGEVLHAQKSKQLNQTGSQQTSAIRDTRPIAGLSTLGEKTSNDRFNTVASFGIQAAEALEFAHSMGIVHRDIKPSNLLIDHQETLWVTDFGLAQVEGDHNLTMTGDVLGTLRYMSPEQLAGCRILDHRTDVYSLGITLYELLTLRPARPQNDRNELARQVAEEDPVAPRKLSGQVPRDLETIILKAISKQPHDRYSTAQQMADDLRRFLGSKPVHARRPTPIDQLAKWMRRHWAVVTTAIGTLLVCLSVSVVVIARAYPSEREQREIATQERADALANLRVAIQAVNDMYSDVAVGWLAADTALSSTQHGYLNRALGIYEQVVLQLGTSEDSQHLASTTYGRMARIYARLNQLPDARAALESAIAILHDLAARENDKPEYRAELANSYGNLAVVLKNLGRHEQALDAFDEAERNCNLLARQFPGVVEHQIDLARYELNRGNTLQVMGRLDDAAQSARRAREHFAELAETSSRLDVSLNLIRSSGLLAEVLMHREQLDEALKSGRDGLRVLGRLRLDFLDNRDVVRAEANVNEQLGQIHYAAGRADEAAQHFRKTLELQRRALKARMKPVQWSFAIFFKEQFRDDEYEEPELFCDYINTQLRLSPALRKLGRYYEAELLMGEAVRSSQILADTHGSLRYMVAHTNSCAELATVLEHREPDEAANAAAMAAAIWHETIESFPSAHSFRSGLHGQQNDLDWFLEFFPGHRVDDLAPQRGTISLGRDSVFGKHTTGVQSFEGRMWEMSIDTFQESAEWRTTGQAYDWFYIAMCHWQLEQHDEARKWYDIAIESMAVDASEDDELKELQEKVADVLGAKP